MNKYFFALAILMIIASTRGDATNRKNLKLLQNYLDNLVEGFKECEREGEHDLCNDTAAILITLSQLRGLFNNYTQQDFFTH